MKKADVVIAGLLALVIIIAVKYFQPQEIELQQLDLPIETQVLPITVEAEAETIRYPVPKPLVHVESESASEKLTEDLIADPVSVPTVAVNPLPTLEDSDDVLRQNLYEIAAKKILDSLLNLNHIIRRFVVTVDNLPRQDLLNSKHRSNQAIQGQPVVEKDSAGLYLGEKNFARYDAFIRLLDSLDSDQTVALYVHYYPLIQAAYEDMGYPSAYFNDRMIAVMDHLLATPDVGGRISLVRPRVLYKYADPDLEALSAGQKVLIRIGPQNASRVKQKLRQLRQALIAE